jgi:hypothetical protein
LGRRAGARPKRIDCRAREQRTIVRSLGRRDRRRDLKRSDRRRHASDPRRTTLTHRRATHGVMESRDRPAIMKAFAEDAVLRSPFTDRLAFEGRQQIDALVGVILSVLDDLAYTDELHGVGVTVLVGHASVDGLRLQFSDHLKLRATV